MSRAAVFQCTGNNVATPDIRFTFLRSGRRLVLLLIAQPLRFCAFDYQCDGHCSSFIGFRAVPQAFRNHNAFTRFDEEIACFGLKQQFTFQNDKALVFVVVRVPALELALKFDEADGEIVHTGQIDGGIRVGDFIACLLDRKELDVHK